MGRERLKRVLTDAAATPVLVRWLDSRQASGGWEYRSELQPRSVVEAASLGWVVGLTDDHILLAQSVADADFDESCQVAGIKLIPLCCVIDAALLMLSQRAAP